MSKKDRIRHLMKASGVFGAYQHLAQRVLTDQYKAIDPDDEPESEVLEEIAEQYIAFMTQIYAQRFSDSEIEELISISELPVMQKLLTLDDDHDEDTRSFMERFINTHFETFAGEAQSEPRRSYAH